MGVVAIVNVAALGMTSNYFYPKQGMMWLVCASALVVRGWTLQRAVPYDRYRRSEFVRNSAPSNSSPGRAPLQAAPRLPG